MRFSIFIRHEPCIRVKYVRDSNRSFHCWIMRVLVFAQSDYSDVKFHVVFVRLQNPASTTTIGVIFFLDDCWCLSLLCHARLGVRIIKLTSTYYFILFICAYQRANIFVLMIVCLMISLANVLYLIINFLSMRRYFIVDVSFWQHDATGWAKVIYSFRQM